MTKARVPAIFVAFGCLGASVCWGAEINVNEFTAAAPARLEGATDIMPLGSAATGVVRELLVREGDRVEAGQLLLRLDCKPIEHELKARLGEQATAEAILDRLKHGARGEDIEIAKALVRLAEARSDEAEQTRERYASLAGGLAANRAQQLQADRDAKIAVAQLDEARQRLALLLNGTRSEEIAEAEARWEATAGMLQQTQARLDQCSVRAPSSGIVLSTHVTPGQFISSAVPTTLIRLLDDQFTHARAEVDERDLAKICDRQQAHIVSDGFPGQSLEARVVSINPGMGRRTILSGDPAEKSDRDVREVLLKVEGAKASWPFGLRVVVLFRPCKSD